jgi:transposase
MAYRYGNRHQQDLLPASIEDYVSVDDPVRAYDAIIESLAFEELGVVHEVNKVGNPAYDPKAMLKLLVYGYSYGIRSSRKLERAVHHNLSFIWLTGGLKPDHKTIAEFRRKNSLVLKGVLRQCARVCLKLDLIAGNTLFADGSKIGANASMRKSWTKKKCERFLADVDSRIEGILSECAAVDEGEAGAGSLVSMSRPLAEAEQLRARVQSVLHDLDRHGVKALNTTDGECARVYSDGVCYAGYNAQVVVDEKHGLIVSSDVVSESNDFKQFARQITQAHDTLGKRCAIACADSGYATTDILKEIHDQGVEVIVPSNRQAAGREVGEFDKESFAYDSGRDCYVCRAGKVLVFRYVDKRKRYKVYRISRKADCLTCRHYGQCTRAKEGKKVVRLLDEEVRQKLEAKYAEPASQSIYKLRKQKVELPFGHIKHNLQASRFLLRGLAGVRAEMSLLSTCFNISRMITILGVAGIAERLIS